MCLPFLMLWLREWEFYQPLLSCLMAVQSQIKESV